MKKFFIFGALSFCLFYASYDKKSVTFKSPFAFAISNDESSYFASSWSGMGFVLGYGAREAYVDYACSGVDPGEGNECDGPPEIGLVRKFTEIAESIFEELEVDSCDAFPTSGSEDVEVDAGEGTVTFTTPTQKIPAAWEGGGTKFDRRLETTLQISGIDTVMVIEVSCNYDKTAMAAMNMVVGDHAPGYTRPINVWLGKKGDLTVADIYVSEVKVATGYVRGAYAFGLEINETAKTYSLWGSAGVHYDSLESNQAVDVYNLTGNFKEHTASLRVKRFVTTGLNEGSDGSQYVDAATLSGLTGSDDATLDETASFDLLATQTIASGQSGTAQGCMDFDEPTTAPTSADACEDLDWSKAPTPVIDADGSFSAAWAFSTMHDKLVEIPDLPE